MALGSNAIVGGTRASLSARTHARSLIPGLNVSSSEKQAGIGGRRRMLNAV